MRTAARVTSVADGSRARQRVAAACGVVLLLGLAGCGGDDKAAPEPDQPSETPALWNPCDAIDPAFVEAAFGSVAKEVNGTPTEPDCRFTPDEASGDPVVVASYLQFAGGLDAAWETMGQPEDAKVTEPVIEGADAARIVTDVVERQLYVTGFVQNGVLIQNVNVVDPAPYDREAVLAGVRRTLAAFSRHAVEAGITEAETE